MNWNEKDCKTVYIYVLLNKADKIAYVGQTADPERRKKEHFEKPAMQEIADDFKKFGKDSFEFRVVDECAYRHRYIVEAYWTKRVARKYALYNVKNGQEHAEKTKKRLSEITSGIHNPMYGKRGENAVNGQCVQMFDKQGNLIKEFCSVGQAVSYLGLKGHSQLYNVAKVVQNIKDIFGENLKDVNKQMF